MYAQHTATICRPAWLSAPLSILDYFGSFSCVTHFTVPNVRLDPLLADNYQTSLKCVTRTTHLDNIKGEK